MNDPAHLSKASEESACEADIQTVHLITRTLYLKEVRRIAALTDEDALREIDGLLRLLGETPNGHQSRTILDSAEDETFERQDAVSALEEMEDEIANAKRNLARSELRDSAADDLRASAEDLGEYWDSDEIRREFRPRIESLKSEALELAKEIDKAILLKNLDSWFESEVRSQVGAYDAIDCLDDIERDLRAAGQLNKEIEAKVRAAKERFAWYRAKKKLDDAELAEAAGKRIKAPKMRDEARIMLKQDWRKAFPGEAPPRIENER